jgi:hypothetical protein
MMHKSYKKFCATDEIAMPIYDKSGGLWPGTAEYGAPLFRIRDFARENGGVSENGI